MIKIKQLLKKIFCFKSKTKERFAALDLPASVKIIPRKKHNISRRNISKNALKVLYRLNKTGYQAFLVGGCVRDLLLDKHPKDFDVATDAHPEEVRRIFRNCRLIGRRFRLAHVFFGREIIEVATFRGHHSKHDKEKAHVQNGMIIRDNVYGTIVEDAERRDFTINALYYNIADFSILDFSTGMVDIKLSTLRMIGEPEQRYKEDPVRMLRAIRFLCKINFALDKATAEPLYRNKNLLEQIPTARLFEECLKLFLSGHSLKVFQQLLEFNLFGSLFPHTQRCLQENSNITIKRFLELTFANTDKRINEGKPITPAFLFAAILWYPMQHIAKQKQLQLELKRNQAVDLAIEEVLRQQLKFVAIPKRFTLPLREIWRMQNQLAHRHGKRAFRTLERTRFRASYDFLLLRAEAGEKVNRLAKWWTKFQDEDQSGRQTMVDSLHIPHKKSKKSSHQGKRKHE